MSDGAVTQGSRLQILNGKEKHWMWKAGIRTVICVLNIIGIGALGWLMSSALSLQKLNEYGYYVFGDWNVGAIITLCVSFLWCALAICIPFLLKPTRPLHPGIAVGIDLVFWLAFIVVGLFTLVAVFNITQFGAYGSIEQPYDSYNGNYQGEYVQAPNGTWFFNITSTGSAVYNYTTGEYDYPPLNTSDIDRTCSPDFTSCQAQDQYVNDVWKLKPRIVASTILVNVVEWLNLILYFALFVWACVDTHRYNRRRVIGKEEDITNRVIENLEKRGIVTVVGGVVQPAQPAQPAQRREEEIGEAQ